MDDDFEKPFGRPSGWHPKLGKGINKGKHVPPAIHALLSEQEIKDLLSRMALDPDFKARILIQVEEDI